jgi:hypothetical protein
MKKIEMTQATNTLEQYANELEHEAMVLTDGGHAVAALLPIDDAELDSLTPSLNPEFQSLINRARAEYRDGASRSADDVRRELGIL